MLKLISIAFAAFVININAASVPSAEPNYTIFKSAIDPDYSVRFVSTQLCDPNVTQYSGYLDMGPSHYFFWFFESKSKSSTRPLTAWLNGGPGCSSMIGLWQENGPCRSNSKGSNILYNEYTWTHFSNMLYIDQPNGVGFSYGNPLTYHVSEGAAMFYEAMQLFYEAFPKYGQVPFHLFGESFAGRYIPHYANYIVDQNLRLENNSTLQKKTLKYQKTIPIESVGIGNGWINPLLQFKGAADMACNSSYGRLVTPQVCQKMQLNYRFCAKLVEACYASDGALSCVMADRYCATNVEGLFESSGRNFYDVRKSSRSVDPPTDFVRLLNSPQLQKEIGANAQLFEECSDKPYEAMSYAGEGTRDSSPALASLLDKGVRVLAYIGDADYLCNWYGNYDVMSKLKFNGSEEYNQLALKPWVFQKKEVGQIQGTDKLTFLRIYEAGHEVPYYQPKNALAMFYKWINGKKFYNK